MRYPLGLLAFLAFLSAGAAQPEVAHALFVQQGRPWVGGEVGGRPFLEIFSGGRWQGAEPGAVFALGAGGWAGTLSGDAALVRTDERGAPRGIHRFGGPLRETAVALAQTERGTLLAGHAEGRFFGENHGGEDVFLAWVEEGRLVRSLTWGTDDDDVLTAMAVAPDKSVYLAGYQMTNEDCIPVSERGFVLKFAPDGERLWEYRFGFEASSRPTALLATGEGVWVAGNTDGALFGPAAGGDDVFVLFLGPDGEVERRVQWGSSRTDLAKRLVRFQEALYLLGETAGDLFGKESGFSPFLARLDAGGNPQRGLRIAAAGEAHAADLAAHGEVLWVLYNTPEGFSLVRLERPLR